MTPTIANSSSRRRVRLSGHSMSPFIPPGSMLTVERASFEEIRKGDVACYIGGAAEVIAHRVVRKTESKSGKALFARGDACDYEEQVPVDALIYVVLRVEHPLLSYDVSGVFGRAAARIALGEDHKTRLAKTALTGLWKAARSIKGRVRTLCTTILTSIR